MLRLAAQNYQENVKETDFKQRFLNIPPQDTEFADFWPDDHQNWL